ncbi:hypothetical protein [Streptosporangium sandarakinum]
MAAATVNHHLAHLSALISWITAHAQPVCYATVIRPGNNGVPAADG